MLKIAENNSLMQVLESKKKKGEEELREELQELFAESLYDSEVEGYAGNNFSIALTKGKDNSFRWYDVIGNNVPVAVQRQEEELICIKGKEDVADYITDEDRRGGMLEYYDEFVEEFVEDVLIKFY